MKVKRENKRHCAAVDDEANLPLSFLQPHTQMSPLIDTPGNRFE